MEEIPKTTQSFNSDTFLKENLDGLTIKGGSSSKKLDERILKTLMEWNIEDDLIVQIALATGGISDSPIFRVYSRLGNNESFDKMRKLLEESLFNKIVDDLHNSLLY